MSFRLFKRGFAACAVIISALTPLAGTPAARADDTGAPGEVAWHRMHFPVQEKVSFSDDFGAPRAGGRSHQGNDIMGAKLNHELAVVDGTITNLRVDDGTGISGNMLTLRGADGCYYYYIHVNN